MIVVSPPLRPLHGNPDKPPDAKNATAPANASNATSNAQREPPIRERSSEGSNTTDSQDKRAAVQCIQTVLGAIERTHGYLSKTVLTQHFSGTESKAVAGLRLQRLPEFGMLRNWKKSHASGLIDAMLDHGLVILSELKMGKLTISLSELGTRCQSDAMQIPEPMIRYVLTAIQSNITSKTPTPDAGIDADAATTRGLSDLPVPQGGDATQMRVEQPIISDWQWTLRMARHGYRLGECALIRGKTPDAILADLTVAMQSGEHVSIEQLFDRRTILAIKEIQANNGVHGHPPAVLQVFASLWPFIQQWLKNN